MLGMSTCLASMRSCVQTPVLPKTKQNKKAEIQYKQPKTKINIRGLVEWLK
jgi:hypothetical protein